MSAVRITVTPLGASRQSAGRVAKRIVDYLQRTKPSPLREMLGPTAERGGSAAVAYFSDSMEGAGVWLGEGAASLATVSDWCPTVR